MGASTVPKPSDSLMDECVNTVTQTAVHHGLNTDDPNVRAFIEQTAAFRAQIISENIWLQSFLHPHLESDKDKAISAVVKAVEFYDLVKSAPSAAREPVGSDHIDWVIDAAKALALAVSK